MAIYGFTPIVETCLHYNMPIHQALLGAATQLHELRLHSVQHKAGQQIEGEAIWNSKWTRNSE